MPDRALQKGILGLVKGYTKGGEREFGLRKALIKEQMRRKLFPKKAEAEAKEKERKLTKTERGETLSQLMRQFLTHQATTARPKETLLEKATPIRSRFEILQGVLTGREKAYFTKKGKVDTGKLFKKLGLSKDDFRAFVRKLYGEELETKVFPTEKRLELFRRTPSGEL